MINTWHQDFKDNAIFRLEENVRMISIALSKVVEEELWTKQNQSLNTLGNQLLHICGNMTQYIVSGLGGNPDERNREEEFSTEDGFTKDELLQRLLLTVQTSTTIIDDATPENLLKKRKVQGFDLSGIGIVLHAVEHFSYHTGQIAMQVKLVIDQPLG
ncbi:DinB family protein, partial [Dokdonia donghaensis]